MFSKKQRMHGIGPQTDGNFKHTQNSYGISDHRKAEHKAVNYHKMSIALKDIQ